jgi:hypothetical protein
MGTTMLIQEPPSQFNMQDQDVEEGAAGMGKPAWQEFFAACDALNARNVASESPVHRQQHLQQERNPPTVLAKVYEWVPSIEDPNVLARKPVTKNMRFDVLLSYPAAQKQYDSWRNEWDCCDHFQPAAALEEDMEDVVIYTASGDDDEIDLFNHNLSPPRISSPFGPLTSPARLMNALEMPPPLLLLETLVQTMILFLTWLPSTHMK